MIVLSNYNHSLRDFQNNLCSVIGRILQLGPLKCPRRFVRMYCCWRPNIFPLTSAPFQRRGAAMEINWLGLGSLLVFYLLILAIGVWAAWKRNRAVKEKEGSNPDNNDVNDIMLAGRTIGPFLGLWTMTGKQMLVYVYIYIWLWNNSVYLHKNTFNFAQHFASALICVLIMHPRHPGMHIAIDKYLLN